MRRTAHSMHYQRNWGVIDGEMLDTMDICTSMEESLMPTVRTLVSPGLHPVMDIGHVL